MLEGVLSENKYNDMLRDLMKEFDTTHVYYLDIPFEETLRRHNMRHKNSDFEEAEMRDWWKEKDYLGSKNERILGEDLSAGELVELILGDVV